MNITPLMNDIKIKKLITDAEIVTSGWGELYTEQEIQLNSKSFQEDEIKAMYNFIENRYNSGRQEEYLIK